MKTYTFHVKASSAYMLLGFIGIICGIVVIFNMATANNNMGWLALLGVGLVYISIKKITKDAAITVKKIIVMDGKIEVVFASNKATSMILNKGDFITEVDVDKITFIEKISRKVACEAFKAKLANTAKWNDLIRDIQ